MLDTLSYKKKCFLLFGLLPTILYLAYLKSFSKTFEAKSVLDKLTTRLLLVDDAKQNFEGLKNDINQLDAIIGKEVASPDIVQQEIFDIFSVISYKATLLKLDESHRFEDEYFNVYTNNLLLQGNFVDLLRTTYFYEKNFEYSRLVSLSFYVKKNPKNRETILFEQLIFQNYDKK